MQGHSLLCALGLFASVLAFFLSWVDKATDARYEANATEDHTTANAEPKGNVSLK